MKVVKKGGILRDGLADDQAGGNGDRVHYDILPSPFTGLAECPLTSGRWPYLNGDYALV